jgi:ribose transport system permease protein
MKPRPEPEATTESTERPDLRRWRPALRIGDMPSSTILLIVAIGIVGIFAILLRDTGFMSPSNLLNIVRATTVISVMAVATVYVISAGEIDLSFAAIPPLAGYVAALLLRADYPVAVAVVSALSAGAAIGLVNGIIAVAFRVPTFIVTLGMIGVVEGLARLITETQSVPVRNEAFIFIFGNGSIGPVPVLLLWTVGIGVLGYIGLRYVPFGKAVLATGGNAVAARYSGIRTSRIKVAVLVLSGMAGALAGLLYAGRLAGVRYDIGSTDLLTVLAAVIIGGTALSGGRGSVVGAIVGSLLVGIINNGLVLLGLDTPQQLLFRGGLIVTAVALSARGGAAQR